ncbi:SDR family NAD(P)-dependent oxidoreductase [Streptomyces hoynatensis]|uniref:SDR family NAD(P)-dependent oxidoreductase n=1 Tax=Streptomyces hoynatensis TaxID=1141874 RepID=A0A3A9ZFE5_9ACTN|nr:SDR family NAD(P)-dependent oxidoreductase [Streptomyces hoynatensis]RKN47033.1 SDR family NAD(P)-dependent oxidoreductase [Streptomyces hoynatensis]
MVPPKIALVTGATSGLGRVLARALAERGFHLLIHGRDAARAAAAAKDVEAAGGTAEVFLADLADLAEVRRLAGLVAAAHPRLDVLVNNAGLGGGPPPHLTREASADGFELRLAVNYLAPVLLTRLLLPALRAAAPARIVNVGSVGQSAPDFDDLHLERGYDGATAYCQSKFALAAFTFDLAGELEGSGVSVNCVHPANFMDTFQVREAGVRPWTTAAAGVPPVLNLAVGKAGEHSGQYFNGLSRSRAHGETYDPAVRQRLREVTGRLLAPFLAGPRPEEG